MIKIDKKNIISFSVGLIVGVIACYMLWGNISDNRDGAGATREQLKTAAEYNRSAQSRVTDIETGLTRSEQAVNDIITTFEDSSRRIEQSATRIDSIETGLAEVERNARQSQQIFDSIRKRGEKAD